MPIYEFKCDDCDFVYEELTSYNGIKKIECPNCGSKNKEKLPSHFSFNFTNPVGTDRWNNSHDYRFHHNLPNVRAQREAAEKASHMGTDPYKEIDDISSGKYFGEVK